MSNNSIQSELRAELKDAMRSRDQLRVDVVRQVETEVSFARAAPGFSGQIDDELYLAVISAYVKKMQKAHDEYRQLGERGAEMAEKLAFEVDFLSRWLPQKLGEAPTRELVRRAIGELGVTDAKAAGRVVGHVMKGAKQSGQELDGALVKRLAGEELGTAETQ